MSVAALMTRSRMIHRTAGLVMACLVAAAGLSGCNYISAGAYIVSGGAKRDAEYKLQDRPTVVVVDDRRNVVNPTTLRRRIADRVSQELLDNDLVTKVIDPRDAMGAMSREDRYSEPMPMDEIGRAVGAEVLIYVNMTRFTNSADGRTPQPLASGNVRVIDVTNREKLFPAPDSEQEARAVQVKMPEMDPSAFQTRSSANKVYRELANEFGREVAKRFYRHPVRDLGGNLNPR